MKLILKISAQLTICIRRIHFAILMTPKLSMHAIFRGSSNFVIAFMVKTHTKMHVLYFAQFSDLPRQSSYEIIFFTPHYYFSNFSFSVRPLYDSKI